MNHGAMGKVTGNGGPVEQQHPIALSRESIAVGDRRNGRRRRAFRLLAHSGLRIARECGPLTTDLPGRVGVRGLS
jgi:hypothetical protein